MSSRAFRSRNSIALLLGLVAALQTVQAEKPNRLPQLKVQLVPKLKELAPQIHARYKSPLYEAVITTRGDLVVLPTTKGEGTGKVLPLEYRLLVWRDQKESKNRTRNVIDYTVRPAATDQPDEVVFKGTHEDDVTMQCTYKFSKESIGVETVCTDPEEVAVPTVFVSRWGIPGSHTFTFEQSEREQKGILKGYELKTRSKSSTTSYAEEQGPKGVFKQAVIGRQWPGRVLTFDFDEGATFQITDYDKEPRLHKGYSLQPEGPASKGVTTFKTTLTFE